MGGDTIPPDANRERTHRCPFVPIAAALSAGIAIDHAVALPRLVVFAAALAALAALAIGRRDRRGRKVALLLSLYAAVGAAVHGAAWRDRGPESITRRIADEPRLATVRGVAVTAPRIDRRRESGRTAAWLLMDRTRLVVEVESIASGAGGRFTPVTGRVQLASAGHLIHLAPGDRFEVTGWMARPPLPRNPGDFDVRDYFRKRRLDAVLSVDHPDAVRRTATSSWNWRRAVAAQRRRLGVLFAEGLSDANGPVGAAMILGDRSTMPLEIRDAYIHSGAMHILAISGVNVGILAVFLLVIARLAGMPSLAANLGVVGCVWCYVLLTDLEPPVVRAAVFLSIWAAANQAMRRAALLNTIAATATLLLLFDPLLLFDIGCRLSFLAVVGMAWSIRMVPLPGAAAPDATPRRIGHRTWFRATVTAQAMGVGVWLFTAPAIAADFGIVSPVGLLLNVLLMPLTAIVMWSGYAFFGVCLLAPWLAAPFAAMFDGCLTLVNAVVVFAGQWRHGHAAVPSPPAWWLAGYYFVLIVGVVRPLTRRSRWRCGSILLAWTAIGLIAGLSPPRHVDALRITVLDVGHGGATLVETGNGRLLLFDCGSMTDNRRAAETVWHSVLARGRTRIDAVVVSHADLDHGNNVPALLHTGSVGALVVARSFLDFDQAVVVDVCESARRAGLPVRLVEAGTSLQLDEHVAIEVLHPTDRPPDGEDNANSIVLAVTYRGRRLLLTGDLEGAGQAELFARYPEGGACDVLFAPHHGGRAANTAELADWANPKFVVASAGRRLNVGELSAVYPGARLYATAEQGAITITIGSDGRLDVETMVPNGP